MNYAISAGHDITADAAVDVLEAGGNAFDAAIAALFAAFVAEPCMASGGGGGFANVYTADHESIVFDFFCQTPRHKRPVSEVEFYPVELDFGDKQEVYHVGKGSSGTPGSIAGIFALHEALGTMPMRELVQPAIQAAAEGVVMNDFQYLDMNLLREILAKDERAQTIFFKDDAIKPVGDKIYMQGFADYLDYLSREGRDAFYRGEVAHKMVADYQVGGGYLQLEDLKNYEVKIRKGLQFIFRRR
ncbi:MAG: gamma-glutamyltransferase, partial [Bacteroidota bacterium]